MAGFTSQGSTFTFNATAFTVTSVSVTTPSAEIVDMTPYNAPIGQNVLVPTGHWTGGAIDVEYISGSPFFDPQPLVRTFGPLVFRNASGYFQRQAVLESATVERRVGEVTRGTMRFLITDFFGP